MPLTNESKAYLPCVMSASGRIDKPLSDNPMTRDAAINYLKRHALRQWRACEAIPQLIKNWDKLK